MRTKSQLLQKPEGRLRAAEGEPSGPLILILEQQEAMKGLHRDACRTIFASGKRGEEERRGPNDMMIDQMWRYPTEIGKTLGFLLEQINK